MRLPVGIAAVFLIVAASASAEEVSSHDRFQLWNKCRPTTLLVEGLPKDAGSWGLNEAAIEVAVRSRLRGARLFTEDFTEPGASLLYVRVDFADIAFTVSIRYYKRFEDRVTRRYLATAWIKGTVGLSRKKNSDFILAIIRRFTDEFVDEYLRVNADSC